MGLRSNDTGHTGGRWRQNRYGFAGFYFLSLLFGWFVLRLVLFFAFKPTGLPASDILHAFFGGLHRDFFAALVETIPLLFWFLIVPERQFPARWHRVLLLGGCFVVLFAQIFVL